MNFVFFTPTITASAIGRMASLVVRQLIRDGHSVTVIQAESEELLKLPTHDFGCRLYPWTSVDIKNPDIRAADAVIYQIGDSYEMHKGAVNFLPAIPGIVCLHDFFLGDLFWGWAATRRPEAHGVLRAWYGDAVASSYFRYENNESFIEGTRNTAPMVEWICAHALACVTHSAWGCDRVLNSCPGPVCLAPLAYSASRPIPIESNLRRREGDRLYVLTIGHVNPNKRVARVIEAIGTSAALRDSVTYRLVGRILPETRAEMISQAEALGVNLVVSGEVDDDTLAEAIEQSDIISCLRWPTLEAASASAIEGMLYGKPIIVTDFGFYRDIPDDCAIKVNHENELEDLRSAIEHLASSEQVRREMGARARAWASRTFTAENYARVLLNAVDASLRARPVLSAFNRCSNTLRRWSGSAGMIGRSELIEPLSIFESGPVLETDTGQLRSSDLPEFKGRS
ncbi:MAG: glycosyltransferase [Hyphomicrobium sp.]|uniref:glycosyltransferase family 4 protein n=1 Tax=Hyphomicrobium sp. TaxID=82 RepID=UPI0039E56C7F